MILVNTITELVICNPLFNTSVTVVTPTFVNI